MNIHSRTRLQVIGTVMAALALAPSVQAQTGGELLYSTHCIACHTTQMHWREKKLAVDWNSLKAQVQRWQATTGLGWKEDEILSVTRYLNDSFYQYPAQADQISLRAR